MSILDWLILIPILGYLVWLLFRRKKTGCSGDCSCCPGCGHKRG